MPGTTGSSTLVKKLRFDKSLILLDVGCGTDRHAFELIQRRYSIIRVDHSAPHLALAREKAVNRDLRGVFLQHVRRTCPSGRNST